MAATGRGKQFPRRKHLPRAANSLPLPVLYGVSVASDAASPTPAVRITTKDATGATLKIRKEQHHG